MSAESASGGKRASFMYHSIKEPLTLHSAFWTLLQVALNFWLFKRLGAMMAAISRGCSARLSDNKGDARARKSTNYEIEI
jgi:hypothetical protein